MAISLSDGHMTRDLFGDSELGVLFSDSAEVRSMLLVEGALASAQGKLGLIPEESAVIINRMAREILIDPGGLAKGMARDGVVVPALVAEFVKAMEAPEHSAYVHKGATSQDIIDTALVLRLRRVFDILDARMKVILEVLSDQAQAHKTTAMAARTRSQIATPTALGTRIAAWGVPFVRHRQRLAEMRSRVLCISLGGASGNLSAFQGQGFAVAETMAAELGLGVPQIPWHSTRDNIAEFANLCGLICGSLGKMAHDLLLSAQIGDGLRAGDAGGSSTMPQKTNPVGAEALLTLARQGQMQVSQIVSSMVHGQERDGAAWALEWFALPQMVIATGAALRHGLELAENLHVDKTLMAQVFADTNGMMMAEAASFALADHMGLSDARLIVKNACKKAVETGEHLEVVLKRETLLPIAWDQVFDPKTALGESVEIVDRFWRLARA